MRTVQGPPQPVRITATEFGDYLAARRHAGDFLAEVLDDCLAIEAIYLRLARADVRDKIRDMNR